MITDINTLEDYKKNMGEFIELSSKLSRNITGLHATVKLSKKDEFSYSVKIIDCPEQYQKPLGYIAKNILPMAYQFMKISMIPYYCSDKDKKEEAALIEKHLKNNAIHYLDILLNKGFDDFSHAVNSYICRMELGYALRHINLINGKYVIGDAHWDTVAGAFVDSQNKYHIKYAEIFKELL